MRFLSFCLVAIYLAFTSALRGEAQEPAPQPNRLESGRTIERAITSRQVDTFLVALDSGAMVRVAVTQRGIDLAVEIHGPRGAILADADNSPDGPKQARAIARRAGDHRIQIYASDTNHVPGRYSLTVEVLSREQVAALAAADRARRAATVDWLASNAVRLKTVDAGHGFDDMEPLRAMVGDAHVVALGEATHGTHEFFAFKHRMFEFLVTKMGFTVFAMEGMMSEGFAINDYVLTGRGDPGKALTAMPYWNWHTEEVLVLIKWMRRWNADPQHKRKVKFYGFDLNSIPRGVTVVRDYLRRVDPAEARVWASTFADYSDDIRSSQPSELQTGLPAARRDSLLQFAGRELARFDKRRSAYVSRSSVAAWEEAREHVRILIPYFDAAVPGANPRDRYMADNVGWILKREGPGTKAMLWAHNLHLSAACAPEMMGCLLRRRLGQDYVVFGFAFNRGGFQALDGPGVTVASRQHTFQVGPSADSSLGGTLAKAGLSLAAVDLRALPAGPVADWFGQPRVAVNFGWTYFDRLRGGYPQHVRRQFDALLFVDSTSAAHPLREGQWPGRDVLPAPANLDLEERTPSGLPAQWYPAPSFGDFMFIDPDYTLSSTSEHVFHGRWSASVSRAPGHHYGRTNGGLEQVVDAKPYQGKWVRLKAMAREEALGADSRVHLWISLSPRFFEQILVSGEKTVTGEAWRPYEIVILVPENTATLRYGLSLVGDGRAWLDDVSLEVVTKPPQ